MRQSRCLLVMITTVFLFDGTALAVGQRPSVEDLQSTLKTSGCAFSISSRRSPGTAVGVRPRQLAALLVSRHNGGAPRSRLTANFSMYSLMSIRTSAFSSSNRTSASARPLSLADAGRPRKHERTDRPAGVLEPGPRPRTRRHGLDGLVLSHHPLMQAILHLDELGGSRPREAADREPVHAPTISAMSSAPTSSLRSVPGPWRAARAASSSASRSLSSFWWRTSTRPPCESASRSACSMRTGAAPAPTWSRGWLRWPPSPPPALLHAAGLLFEVGKLLLERLETAPSSIVGFLRRASRSISSEAAALELIELDRHRVDLHRSRDADSSTRSIALSAGSVSVM